MRRQKSAKSCLLTRPLHWRKRRAKALKALENKNSDAALKALAEVTGKLDLIVARDPKLAQAPVATEVVTYDLLSNLDTIKSVIQEAKAHLNDGEIQKARPLVSNLASEIQFRTHHIPLATYPVGNQGHRAAH